MCTLVQQQMDEQTNTNRLIILPDRLPEILQGNANVDDIMQFTGDVKVENLLNDFVEQNKPNGPNYLVQRLKIPRNDTAKDYGADILDCSAFLMTSQKTVVLFVNCIATSGKQSIIERAQKTCHEIAIRTNILSDVFQTTVTPTFLCFVCFDETEENFTDDQRNDCFEKIKVQCFLLTMHKVRYTRENINGSKVHKFLDPDAIKSLIPQTLIGSGIMDTVDIDKLHSVVPSEKELYLRKNVFQSDAGISRERSLSVSLHSDADLKLFCDQYFSRLGSTLITLPDFDRIKSTKLYPLKPGQDLLEHFECPGLLPGPSMYDYVGEIEQFWPNFNNWFPNSQGLLMHSFSQKELLQILQNRNLFSFEFDWLFWMNDKLIVFEVAMGKKPVGPKLEQVFTRHFPILRTLFHCLNPSAAPDNVVRSMFEKCVNYVIFFAGIDHKELLRRIPGAVKSCEKYRSNSEVLNNLYFVGVSNENDRKFWKYDVIKKLLISCDIQPVSVSDHEKSLLKRTMSFFAMGYFTNKNDEVLQSFEQSLETLEARYIDCQQQFLNKFLESSDYKTNEFLHKLDIILSPQQFGIILEDPRLLFCPAEAGSGKTQLLLAKALQSALDESIDGVYFCIPVPRNEETWERKQLNTIVKDFVERNKIEAKVHLISDNDLEKKVFSKPVQDLQKSVLLIDEFHFNYEDAFSIKKSEFKELALRTFPFFRNCWLVNVTLHYLLNTRQKLNEFIPTEMFIMRPLNVQYRSAKHISEFCSNLVQMNAKGKFSSPRIHGTFISKTQLSVKIEAFSANETSSADVIPLKDFNPHSVQSEEYKDDKLVVVICSKEDMGKWRNWICLNFGAETDTNTVICCEDGIASCFCSGGEKASVLLIIDGPTDAVYKQNSEWYNDMFRVICSRAQFELVIYVSNQMPEILETLRKLRKPCSNDPSGGNLAYRTYPEIEAIQSFQQSLESKIPDETELRTLVRKCNGEMKPTEGIRADLKKDRLIVILCENDEKRQWRESISNIYVPKHACRKFYTGVENPLVLSLDDYDYISLSGFEVASILFFIDSPDKATFHQRKEDFGQLIITILSRATHELVVYIRRDLKYISDLFTEANFGSVEIRIKNYPVVPFRKSQHFGTRNTSQQLIFWHYFEEHKVFQLKKFFEGAVNRQILLLMGVKRSSSVLKTLFRMKKVRKPQKVFQDVLVHSLVTGCTEMLNWALKLMEKTGFTKPSNLEEILSFAAFKPKMLATIIEKLNYWLPSEFTGELTLTIGGERGSLLSVLCYANAHISDVEIWKHLWNLWGEDDLFLGMNPIQYAEKHKNTDSIALLCSFESILYWRSLETMEIDYYR